MKKLIKKVSIYSFLTINLLHISCDDFLEVEPDLQVSISEQLATKNGVLEAYIGVYTQTEDLFSSIAILYADLQGGNIAFTPKISADNNGIKIPNSASTNIENSYSFTDDFRESDYVGFYNTAYTIINQINTILEQKDSYSFFPKKEQNQLNAELLTIRALVHYQVSLFYAQNYNFTANASHIGIIYNTNVLTAGEDFPFRISVSETYNLLQNDLDSALNLYTNTRLVSGPEYSYFNATSTKALYARIALQMNDWQKAKNFADDVIINSGVTLTSNKNYINEWKKNRLPINEILYEFPAPIDRKDDQAASTAAIFYRFKNKTDYAPFVASGDLLGLYNDTDIRKNLFIRKNLPTLKNTITTEDPYYFTKKFQNEAGVPLLRLSELYLIRAEANVRLTNSNSALVDLNIIRERAGLNALTSVVNILEEIFLERRRELAFEGQLLFDIARFKKNIIRKQGCLAMACNLEYPSNFFVLPIPKKSIILNQNIKQNDGY